MLRITSSDWFGTHVLAPVLAEFSVRHPGVTIELLTDARFLSLSRREADLAFRIRPFDDPDVVSRTLLHMRYGAYVRQGLPHPVAGDGAGIALLALCLLYTSGQDESAWGSLEQRVPDRGFEGAQSPAHRRLGQRQCPRRRPQGSGAGNRQEDPQVAPFHPQRPCLSATPCNCA